jgi:tRNA pseudouridine32 synthase/23S rRNA pseudouridine746 synthase
MATLGIPIKNDPLYPEINDPEPNDFSSPLQLLAKKISFRDPVGAEELEIESRLVLEEIALEHPE